MVSGGILQQEATKLGPASANQIKAVGTISNGAMTL
jgi:hypothetical protein